MTECDEVAASLPPLPAGVGLHEAREHARRWLPEESMVVQDNVAEALWRAANDSRRVPLPAGVER